MLRTELIRIEGEKLDSVEFDMSSVLLRHVTLIIAVLAAGFLAAILNGTVERLLLQQAQPCEWRGIETQIRNKTFKPKTLTFLNVSHATGSDMPRPGISVGISSLGWWWLQFSHHQQVHSRSPLAARSNALVCDHSLFWDCGFESRRRHGCLNVASVVCCQIEVCKVWYSHYRQILHTLLHRILWYPQLWGEKILMYLEIRVLYLLVWCKTPWRWLEGRNMSEC